MTNTSIIFDLIQLCLLQLWLFMVINIHYYKLEKNIFVK